MQSTMRNGVGRGWTNGRGVAVLAIAAALVGCECDPGTVSREAQLELAATGLQFGTVSVGQKSVKSVGLRNTGSAYAVVTGFEVAAPFGIEGESTFELGPGESRDLQVFYAPTEPNATAEENHIGELRVLNDTEAGPLTVSLVGHAIEPELLITPTELAFGDVDVGTSEKLPLTVENRGSDKFEITKVSIAPAGAFSVDASKLVGTYQPGAKTTVEVDFAPEVGEAVSATLELETTVPGMEKVAVPLSGTGLAPEVYLCYALEGEEESCLDATQTSGALDFGAIDEGSSRKASFTLRNDGNTPVQLFGLLAGGAMAADITGNPCLAENPVPDFVFSKDRFGPQLPADPTEAEPNPPTSETIELVYTPTHTPGCYGDTTDRARILVKVGSSPRAPIYQLDIQGASKLGRIRFSEVTYTNTVTESKDEYRIFNDGAGDLIVHSLEIVEGYSGPPTTYNCQTSCLDRRPCSDPAVSNNDECKAFSFLSPPKTDFVVSAGGSARVTDGVVHDLQYKAPEDRGKKVAACVRVNSTDPVYPTICARLEGVR